MALTLWVGIGGAIGAILRHFLNIVIARVSGSDFPWHTMLINISGSFAMGLLIALMAQRWNVSNELRAFLTIGILGGYTTFSAFSLDFAFLVERKAYMLAGAYALGSVVISLVAIFIGLALGRAFA
ncbi:fluoride efflux transporter CrcB [Taklimakanibacter lacteus]|uniref:fluoride efflux transporter CrcB n=1 Tax=Taklimakanibacter lacteus TaxID=2268456 RepID=UPI000E668F28